MWSNPCSNSTRMAARVSQAASLSSRGWRPLGRATAKETMASKMVVGFMVDKRDQIESD